MGRHRCHNADDYWNPLMYNIGRHMCRNRWQQIHRFLTINAGTQQSKDPWWWKIEPIASEIRSNCRKNLSPPSWLAVDEIMVPFTGRSVHTIKIKNKPVKEGYKMWLLGFKGYVWDFIFHSAIHGPEESKKSGLKAQQISPLKPVSLAPTYQVPLLLCQHLHELHPDRKFLVFLDNLFLNVNLAHALLAINIACMGTTRKNATGVPEAITKAKEENRLLVWNSIIAVVVDFCLCFVWQDNNAVISITTAYSLHREEDRVTVNRHRPKATSTNADITRPIFGGFHEKMLDIPTPINDYNHHMNGVDISSHLRVQFTCLRPHEQRNWRPLFYILVDTCVNDAYLLWKQTQDSKDHNLHHKFHTRLTEQLLLYDIWTPAPGNTSLHRPIKLEKLVRCVYGYKRPGDCVQGDSKKASRRRILGEISGNARATTRPRQVRTGCQQCGVHLCIDRDCWLRYHASDTSN